MELTNILTNSSSFRFQNQKVMFTFKTHIDKWLFGTFLEETTGRPLKKFYAAHENGVGDEHTPYEHTHVVVDFGRIFQTKNPRFFDFDGIHPHISLIRNKTNWKKACKYITKEDTSVVLEADDHFGFNAVESIWDNASVSKALEKSSLKDAMATIAIFAHKPMDLPDADICEEDFYPWQKDFYELLRMPPSARKITWLSEPVGNVGKTVFAKWLCLTQPDKAVMLNNVGKITDFSQNMKNFWSQGWRGDTVFLNLSRSYTDRTSIYEACEIIADGYITCTKYAGGVIWLPRMHVVVLANFDPQLDKLSWDRWNAFTVDEDKILCPVTLIRAKFEQLVKPKFEFKAIDKSNEKLFENGI